MFFAAPVNQLIQQRFSCRTFELEPISKENQTRLERFIESIGSGPFGNTVRFRLVSASLADRKSLKGLGTYGFIRDASGFIIGAIDRQNPHNLEDFGYLMEKLILYATGLGLGTCWLGGTFTKSNFGKKIAVRPTELVPAVVAIGTPAKGLRWVEKLVRSRARKEYRLPWEELFYYGDFSQTMSPGQAGLYAMPLEMTRLAPSASNKQPWRLIKSNGSWQFYLKRTPGYRESTLVRLFTVADLQRIDMGIAMCHFELSLVEAGLQGKWVQEKPEVVQSQFGIEYVASWD